MFLDHVMRAISRGTLVWLPEVMTRTGLVRWVMRGWPPRPAVSTGWSKGSVGRFSLVTRWKSMKLCSVPESIRALKSWIPTWGHSLTGIKRTFFSHNRYRVTHPLLLAPLSFFQSKLEVDNLHWFLWGFTWGFLNRWQRRVQRWRV